jgi:hypothetical protein
MKHALLLLLLSLAACESRRSATPENATPATTDSLAYERRTYESRSRFCVSPDSLCAVASFRYPVFPGDAFQALNDSLLTGIVAVAQPQGPEPDSAARPGTLQAVAKAFTDEYDAFIKDNRDSLRPTATWSLEVKTEVLRQTPKWVCVAHQWYSYTGGAHPNHATRYANYDRATGHRLTLTELFQPDFQKTLTGIAERHFRQNERLKPGQSLAGTYFFAGDRFALNDNFTLTPTGLKFLYNPYEIKPYVAGETELEIPFSELEGILKKDAVR